MLKKAVLIFIKLYQIFLSPFLGSNCRFYPSCSNYAYKAITKFGIKGTILVALRLFKCRPFGGSGIDDVPEEFNYLIKKKNI